MANMDGIFDIAPLLHEQPPAQRRMLVDVVRRVMQQMPSDLAAVRAACASDAPDAAAPLLHRLRGSVGSLGAQRFVAAALHLEACIGADGMPAALAHVESELALTRDAAMAWLQLQSAPAATPAAGAPHQAELARFALLLAQRNMEACELLPGLRQHFDRRHGAAFAAQMDEHMAQLDFGAALGLLEQHLDRARS